MPLLGEPMSKNISTILTSPPTSCNRRYHRLLRGVGGGGDIVGTLSDIGSPNYLISRHFDVKTRRFDHETPNSDHFHGIDGHDNN